MLGSAATATNADGNLSGFHACVLLGCGGTLQESTGMVFRARSN
jgi:hypothetical protein